MKAKIVVIKSSLTLMIISSIMITVAYFLEKNCYCANTELIKNLGFGLFTSSCVTFGITGPEYYVAKKRALENYLVESQKLLKAFLGIEYFLYGVKEKLLLDYFYYKDFNAELPFYMDEEKSAYNELVNYYKSIGINLNDFKDDSFEKILEVNYKSVIKKLSKTIDNYIEFKKNSFYELDSCYAELSFFTKRGNKKYQEWIYNNLYSKTHSYFAKTCNLATQLLDLSKDNPTQYYRTTASLINDLQSELFEIDQDNQDNISAPDGYYISEIIWKTYTNELAHNNELLRSMIYNCKAEEVQMQYLLVTNLKIKTENEKSSPEK